MKSKGKGKSKDKSKNKMPIYRHSSLPAKTPKKKRTVKKVKAEIVLNYIEGKVIFDIASLDEHLRRSLIYATTVENDRLQKFSILFELNLPKRSADEKVYRHSIDTKQAISLYTKLINKQKGEANVYQQVKQLIQIVKSYQFHRNQLSSQLKQEMLEYNEDIYNKTSELKVQLVSMTKQILSNYKKSEDYYKAKLLEERIKELSDVLFNQIIIAIRQVDDQKVQVILEQCYPALAIQKEFLLEIIGQERYIQKKINFVKYYSKAKQAHKCNTNFIVCHFCKQPLFGSYVRCKKRIDNTFIPSHKNSPQTFYRHLIALDYCYKQQQLHPSDLFRQLDYYKYFKTTNRYVCNRFICIKCVQKYITFGSAQEIDQYICPFCDQQCACNSCTIIQEIIKSLALLKDILTKNHQPINLFYELINLINIQHPIKVQRQNYVRNTFREPYTRKYNQSYNDLTMDFQNINNVMDNFQDEVLRENSLFQSLKMMITPYMMAVRKYMMPRQDKQTKQFNRKSLQLIKTVNEQYQLSAHKYQQGLQRYVNKPHKTTNSSKQIKEPTIKQKMDKFPYTSYNHIKYKVAQDVDNQLIYNDHLELTQQEKLIQDLEKELKPATESNAKNTIFIPRELPYSEEDYDLAMHVPENCKIPKQKDIQIKFNKDNKIFYEWNDPIRGVGTNISKVVDFTDQLLEYIEDNYSDDEDIEEQDVDNRISSSGNNDSMQQQSKNRDSDPFHPFYQANSSNLYQSVGSSQFLDQEVSMSQSQEQFVTQNVQVKEPMINKQFENPQQIQIKHEQKIVQQKLAIPMKQYKKPVIIEIQDSQEQAQIVSPPNNLLRAPMSSHQLSPVSELNWDSSSSVVILSQKPKQIQENKKP